MLTSFAGDAYLGDLALQADGKLIAVGNASNGADTDWRIARYKTDGTLDAIFGSAGIITVDFGGNDNIDAVAVQDDGKILVGGYSRPAATPRWTVGRYRPNGMIDTEFGASGFVTTEFFGLPSNLLGIAVQADGKIVATGYTDTNAGHGDVAVTRYHPDGSPDLTFGSAGVVTTPISSAPNPNDRGNALAIQPDGRIVVLADFDAFRHDNVALLRYEANGALDRTFGSGGRVIDSFRFHNGARDVALQADGRIVITGSAADAGSGGDTYLARYHSNGTPDAGFGAGGKVVTSFSAGTDTSNVLAIRSDGKILIAGAEDNGGVQDSVVRRFGPDGTLDTSFGSNGSVVVPLSEGADGLNAIAEQPDGRIVVAGTASGGSRTDWVIARLAEGPRTAVTVLGANADTYVQSGQANRNGGGAELMRVQSNSHNRVLVRFDQAALEAKIGDGTVLTAKLQLTITDNGDKWGASGRPVDAHRILVDWTEGNGTEDDRGTGPGATWNCASDSQIANQAKDCRGATAWEMGRPHSPALHPWAQVASATQTIANHQTGIVEYDVTADVVAFLNRTQANHGWLIKKRDERRSGMVALGTKEIHAAAELVITWTS